MSDSWDLRSVPRYLLVQDENGEEVSVQLLDAVADPATLRCIRFFVDRYDKAHILEWVHAHADEYIAQFGQVVFENMVTKLNEMPVQQDEPPA